MTIKVGFPLVYQMACEGNHFGFLSLPTLKWGGKPKYGIQSCKPFFFENPECFITPMNTSNTDQTYQRLALAVFRRAVLDARCKNPEYRLDALAWLHSVGYSWLINWGFAIQPGRYAFFLAQLEQQSATQIEERRNDHAA